MMMQQKEEEEDEEVEKKMRAITSGDYKDKNHGGRITCFFFSFVEC